MAQSKTVKAVR